MTTIVSNPIKAKITLDNVKQGRRTLGKPTALAEKDQNTDLAHLC